MIKYDEWLNHQEEIYGTTTDHNDGILENQMEQLVSRLAGLLHDVPETKKSALVDRFMRQIEERVLGL